MVTLGELLSRADREAVANARLSTGTIIRVHCDFTDPPKAKLLLVLCTEPEVLVYVVNSEVNRFIKNRDELMKCQVTLRKANYDFLAHDSVINCSEVKTDSNIGNLMGKMIEDVSTTYRGRILEDSIAEVIAATKFSPGISQARKDIILACLNALLKANGQ